VRTAWNWKSICSRGLTESLQAQSPAHRRQDRRGRARGFADHLGAADHLAAGSQKEIFEDELSIAANKWCAAGAACYLTIISLRPCFAFDDLIKRPAIGALELDCPEHGPPPPRHRLLHRKASFVPSCCEGAAAAVGFDFFAVGLSCQSSDGNVSAKLRKPSTSITANAVTIVIWAINDRGG
jgi:hypothetical protein